MKLNQRQFIFLAVRSYSRDAKETVNLFKTRTGTNAALTPWCNALEEWPDYTYVLTGRGPKQTNQALINEQFNYKTGLEIIRLNQTLKKLKTEYKAQESERNLPKVFSLKEKNIPFE